MQHIKNCTEYVVEQRMDEMQKRFDFCDCQNCRADVACYVLNRLPPRYYRSDSGKIYSIIQSINHQYETDILMLFSQAAELIKNNPRH